jgi:hypothetical protein
MDSRALKRGPRFQSGAHSLPDGAGRPPIRTKRQRAKKFWAQGSFAVLCPHLGPQQRLSSLTGQQRDPEYALAHVCFSVLLLPPFPSPRPFGSRVRALVDACPGFRNLEHGFCRSVLYDLMVPHLKMRIRILIFE